MKKYTLEIIVFVSGAVVMILELVGSRILAPYIGTSIYVWTSLIGVILGCLSLGYWWGGRIADKKPNYKTFSKILFTSAIFIGLITFNKSYVLGFVGSNIQDIRMAALVDTLILFAIPSVLLGMVSPYAVKLKIKDLNTTGKTVGNLYAISTIGSIVGTFLAGFFLIAFFGNTKILLILSLVMIAVSLIAYRKSLAFAKVMAALICLLALPAFAYMDQIAQENGLIEIDTNYNNVWIYNAKHYNGKAMKYMRLNNNFSSAMFLKDDKLVYKYTRYYHLVKHFNPDFKKTLMLGGAAYSYPMDYLRKYPDATIDVVEIDPKLTELAKKHFRLQDNPRLSIYHEDARTFLNQATQKYDAIFGDVFSSSRSIPHQLTTQEAVQKMFDILNDKGVVLINLASAIEGEKGKFLRAQYTTYKTVFPQVYLFPVQNPDNGLEVQNVMLLALKSKTSPTFTSQDSILNKYLTHLWQKEITQDMPILTDDHAPVERFIKAFISPEKKITVPQKYKFKTFAAEIKMAISSIF